MFRRLGVVVAIIAFAMSVSSASAVTVPINEIAGAPAVTTLQQTVGDIANDAAQIITSIEAAVGRIVGEIADRVAGVEPSSNTLSSTASAAANAIDQLFGTAITNPSITGGSITGASLSGGSVSANSLSVSGDTSLSGNLNVSGNFTAGSISFGAASSSNSITTNATSTNLFPTLANFGTAIVNTLNASVANIVGFVVDDISNPTAPIKVDSTSTGNRTNCAHARRRLEPRRHRHHIADHCGYGQHPELSDLPACVPQHVRMRRERKLRCLPPFARRSCETQQPSSNNAASKAVPIRHMSAPAMPSAPISRYGWGRIGFAA
jgi:hypothetical protein